MMQSPSISLKLHTAIDGLEQETRLKWLIYDAEHRLTSVKGLGGAGGAVGDDVVALHLAEVVYDSIGSLYKGKQVQL